MDIANASLLDEATAAAEAMALCHRLKGAEGRNVFVVSAACHPQNIAVVQTRAKAPGIEVVVAEAGAEARALDAKVFSLLLQYPATDGAIHDYAALVEQTHAVGALAVVAADLLSLTLFRPPGEFGADVVVGSAQRFGVPLGYGGPHAAFFATRDAFKRQMPGRLVGVTKDARGRPALRSPVTAIRAAASGLKLQAELLFDRFPVGARFAGVLPFGSGQVAAVI